MLPMICVVKCLPEVALVRWTPATRAIFSVKVPLRTRIVVWFEAL